MSDIWSRRILELSYVLSDKRRLSISLYSLITCGEVGFVYYYDRCCRRCRILYFLVQIIIHYMYFSCPIGWCILSFLASGDMFGRFWSPKDYEWDMLIHRILWSKDGAWLKDRQTHIVMLSPIEPQIPSMGCLILLIIIVPGPFLPYLQIIISLMKTEERKVVIIFPGMYSFSPPIITIWSHSPFHCTIWSWRTNMKVLLVLFFLPNCEKWLRYWVYTEAYPPLVAGCTGLQHATMGRVDYPWPRNS